MSTLAAVNLKNPSSSTNNVVLATNGDLQFNSGYGSAATAYGCRAWVNFNGQGTVAISASGNVSSITDNGTGSYTVNFTTAMVDANYCVTMSAQSLDGMGGYGSNSARTTTSVGVSTRNGSNNQTDRASVSVAIFR